MTTREREPGQWFVDVSHGGVRKQVTIYGDAQAASAEEQRLLAELVAEADKKDVAKSWSLETAVDKVTAAIWSQGANARSSTINAQACLEFFGARTLLPEIDTDRIDEFKEHLRERGNSNATINRKLSALSRILSFARQRGKLSQVPHMPKEVEFEGRIRWLTFNEEDQLLGVLKLWGKQDHLDFLTVAIDTGLRPSEQFRLTPQYIDWATGLISIWKTKNRKPRSIPMTQRVREVLERRKAMPRLFPYTTSWMMVLWNRAKNHLGLTEDPLFIPYVTRHTFASRLIQNSVSLAIIQQLMGHKSLSTTMRYAHLAPVNISNAIQVMERARQAAPSPTIHTADSPVNAHGETKTG